VTTAVNCRAVVVQMWGIRLQMRFDCKSPPTRIPKMEKASSRCVGKAVSSSQHVLP
jgi:hypothetical protein